MVSTESVSLCGLRQADSSCGVAGIEKAEFCPRRMKKWTICTSCRVGSMMCAVRSCPVRAPKHVLNSKRKRGGVVKHGGVVRISVVQARQAVYSSSGSKLFPSRIGVLRMYGFDGRTEIFLITTRHLPKHPSPTQHKTHTNIHLHHIKPPPSPLPQASTDSACRYT